MTETKPVGELLRGLRERRGDSLRAVARDLGVDPSYLSKVERGEKPPSPALRTQLTTYYDADPEEVEIAEGLVPSDIAGILLEHPEVIGELRKRYGSP